MKILMLCHDRQIDRRIIVQAQSLNTLGHEVLLLALPLPSCLENEVIPGLVLYRIGVEDIFRAQNSLFSKLKLTQFLHGLLPKIYQYQGLFRWLLNLYRLTPKMMAKIKFRLGGSPSLVMSAIFNFKESFVQEGLKHDFDLVQVHDLPLLEAGVELAKARNCPLVYDAHELFAEQIIFDSQVRSAFIQHERKFIKECDLVFTVNESIALEMAQRYSIKPPVVLVNALDLPSHFNLQQDSHRFRRHFGLSEDKRIVLLQAGLSPHRNLENLVQAFAQVKTSTAVLIMMGSGVLENKLIQIAKKLKLYQTKVYFLPAVPQDELLYYTAAADLGIIPYPPLDLNTYYCTPNKLFEFIQAGLPILANDLPELRRFVHETDFGMVYAMKTPQDIADAIDLALLELQKKKWKEKIIAKRADYSWQNQAKVYLQAMQQVRVANASW